MFKNHKTDRKKLNARVPVYKHKCVILPETALFEVEECEQTMDIIVMAVSTKSNSTNVRGGSSTTPFSIISTRKAQFLAAQVENMKMMSNPLAARTML